jgi:hypothetical protein
MKSRSGGRGGELRHPGRQGRLVLPHSERGRGTRPGRQGCGRQACARVGADRRSHRRQHCARLGTREPRRPARRAGRGNRGAGSGREPGCLASKALGKRTFYDTIDLGLEAAYALSMEVMAESALTPDGREAMLSFLEKRRGVYPPRR